MITLTALNDLLFDSFEIHRILVVAPLRVARFSWGMEIEKWDHLKILKYTVVVGTEKERLAALSAKADIYIINRENVQWLVENTVFDYDMIVIDELSSFKNHQSKRFKALMKIRPMAKRVVGLTGTPSSNGLMDLFAEFKVLDMGERLGRFIGNYRTAYFKPDRMNGPIVYSYKPLPGAEDETAAQLEAIAPDDVLRVRKGSFGCEALVKDRAAFARKYPMLLVERTTLEDIMLFVGKGEAK